MATETFGYQRKNGGAACGYPVGKELDSDRRSERVITHLHVLYLPNQRLQLCDDGFEEHVLGYSPEQTGLHLHGLNESTKLFKTLPPATVDAFAEEWGFIVTKSIVMNTIPDVKKFTEETGETGSWNGEAIEGFVVRTHVVEPPAGENSRSASPYAPGSTFFFKVKFDEPYMMYRDWRELTKKLLSAKGPLDQVNLPSNKMKRPETKLYVKWVKEEINKNPSAFSEYTKGKGIISTRERFLQWMAGDEGNKALKGASKAVAEVVKPRAQDQEFGKTIIVPVAIPGCGEHNCLRLKQVLMLNGVFPQGKRQSALLYLTCLVLRTHRVTMCMPRNPPLYLSKTCLICSRSTMW
jgi:tRNA splicing ligase